MPFGQAAWSMVCLGRRSSLLWSGRHPTAGAGATLTPGQSEGQCRRMRSRDHLETRGATPPNGRHTQTPSTYNPVFVPLRRHPRPMALVSKCPRRKVGGFSARAARCPRRSTSLCPSRRERLIFLDRDDSAGPASHHRPLLAARPMAEAFRDCWGRSTCRLCRGLSRAA